MQTDNAEDVGQPFLSTKPKPPSALLMATLAPLLWSELHFDGLTCIVNWLCFYDASISSCYAVP